MYNYLKEKMLVVANEFGERLLLTPHNPVSFFIHLFFKVVFIYYRFDIIIRYL